LEWIHQAYLHGKLHIAIAKAARLPAATAAIGCLLEPVIGVLAGAMLHQPPGSARNRGADVDARRVALALRS